MNRIDRLLQEFTFQRDTIDSLKLQLYLAWAFIMFLLPVIIDQAI